MTSLKAGGGVMAILAIALTALWAAARIGLASATSPERISLMWRIAIYLANWWIRVAPLGTFAVGLAALAGALLSRGMTIRRERDVLGGWLVLGFATSGLLAILLWAWPAGRHLESFDWWYFGVILAGLGGVSWIVSAAAALHLQMRLRQLGSPVPTWHVGVAAGLLIFGGPMVLLVGLWVWWHGGAVPTVQEA